MVSISDAGDARWYRFLSRWSLFAGLVALGLFLAFFIAILPASQNSLLPAEYIELAAASQSPLQYRLTIILDVTGWFRPGGFFPQLAAILVRRTPLRRMLLL